MHMGRAWYFAKKFAKITKICGFEVSFEMLKISVA